MLRKIRLPGWRLLILAAATALLPLLALVACGGEEAATPAPTTAPAATATPAPTVAPQPNFRAHDYARAHRDAQAGSYSRSNVCSDAHAHGHAACDRCAPGYKGAASDRRASDTEADGSPYACRGARNSRADGGPGRHRDAPTHRRASSLAAVRRNQGRGGWQLRPGVRRYAGVDQQPTPVDAGIARQGGADRFLDLLLH